MRSERVCYCGERESTFAAGMEVHLGTRWEVEIVSTGKVSPRIPPRSATVLRPRSLGAGVPHGRSTRGRGFPRGLNGL